MVTIHFGPPRAPRFIRAVPVLYRAVGEEEWQRGITIDLSESGMLLEAAQPIRVAKRLELSFQLAEPVGRLGPDLVRCVGKVTRHGFPTRSVPHPLGVQFVEARSRQAEANA